MIKISILVVEDDEKIRDTMVKILSRKYQSVFSAENGLIGLEKYRELKPDIVITDIRMPAMSGLEMVRQIREIDNEIPIIVTSAFNDSENLMEAINLGVDRFIVKPVNIEYLHRDVYKIAQTIIDKKASTSTYEKMAFLTQAIMNSEDGICLYSLNNDIIFFNNAFCKIFLQFSNNIIQSKASEIFAQFPEILEFLLNLNTDNKNIEFTINHDNKTLNYRLSLSPIYFSSGTHEGYLMVFHDITYNIDLEEQLRKEKDRALQSNKFKTEFLSAMSHDIKTPMNLIVGLVELLLSENPTDEQKKHLNLIQRSGQNLVRLINDILDTSKIEAGKLLIENVSFHLHETVGFLLATFAEEAKKKNINLVLKFENELRESYVGDPYRLQQILINLIGNALKFTQNGSITLFVKELPFNQTERILEFTVSDTGIGIAPENLNKIFEAFQQEKLSVARKFGGTGLGTAIAKNLSRLMGGDIHVVSPAVKQPGTKENPGAEFTFTVKVSLDTDSPVSSNNLVSKQEQSVEEIRNRNLSVLIVEDNEVNQLLLQKLLEYFGVNFDIAGNGRIALEKITEKNYDAIFMDIEMPVMNGIDAAVNIRKAGLNIPIIACTANNFNEDLREYQNAGMEKYIVKPYNKENILDILLYITNK